MGLRRGNNCREQATVCFFFSFVTLHDDIDQLPGMQKTLAIAHFVDNKWAFYDFWSLGLFDKNLTSAIGEEALDKTVRKGYYFRFSMEYSFFKWLYYLNVLNKKFPVGPKLKLIKTSFRKHKKRSTLRWKITPNMQEIGSFDEIWLKNWFPTHNTYSGYQQYNWIQIIPKTTSKYLPFETNLGSVAQTD